MPMPGAEPVEQYLDAEATAELLWLEDAHRRLAYEDPANFCSYALRNEETNRRVVNSLNHQQWHDFLTVNRRAVIWAHVEAAKTQQVSIGRVIWELGHNHNLRVVVVSNTYGQAERCCRAIGRYIERSEEVHRVFPDLRKQQGMPWTAHMLTVERETRSKDPSVQTCGVHGNILGARIDLLILDDILDHESTATPTMRADTIAWVKSTLEGRLTRDARVWAVGMIWHRDDLLHHLAANPIYRSIRSPVLTPAGTPTWPEQWPLDRIEFTRKEMGPIEFPRQMLCEELVEGEQRFKKEWIDQCLKRGAGKELCYALHEVPPGYRTYTGVDLGTRDDHTAAETVLFTIAVAPNEDREILDIQAGRWHGPDIVERIIDCHRRYQSVVYVENVAAQEFILQFTRAKSAVPVKPFATTGNRITHPSFGLEVLGVEMANKKWIIPNTNGQPHPELVKWISEMLYYDPRKHTGDRLMASWFAAMGAKIGGKVGPKIKNKRIDLMTR